MTVDVLYLDGCAGYEQLLPRLRELVERSATVADVRLVAVDTPADAERHRFLGSPSVRVNGRDVEPGADVRADYGLKCRLYRPAGGAYSALPPDEWIADALARAR